MRSSRLECQEEYDVLFCAGHSATTDSAPAPRSPGGMPPAVSGRTRPDHRYQWTRQSVRHRPQRGTIGPQVAAERKPPRLRPGGPRSPWSLTLKESDPTLYHPVWQHVQTGQDRDRWRPAPTPTYPRTRSAHRSRLVSVEGSRWPRSTCTHSKRSSYHRSRHGTARCRLADLGAV